MSASTFTYTKSLPSSSITMASNAFRQQITQLLYGLTRCYELTDVILSNRRLGSNHDSFDRLQDGLRASASEIQLRFNVLRKVIGSKMDQGDEKARSALDISLRDMQVVIKAKLFDIAYKRHHRRESAEATGFKDLLRRCRVIEREVTDTLQSLGQRLVENGDSKKKNTATKTYAVQSMADKYLEQNVNEEVVVRLKDLDTLLDHIKNSWVEKWVDGEILYVNKFDAAKTQWERPTGYIKQLARLSRRPSITSSGSSRHSSVCS